MSIDKDFSISPQGMIRMTSSNKYYSLPQMYKWLKYHLDNIKTLKYKKELEFSLESYTFENMYNDLDICGQFKITINVKVVYSEI